MAESGSDSGADETPSAPKKKISLQLILALGNVVLVLAALGVLVYTKLLFKKPTITEDKEIAKKEEEIKAPLSALPAERVSVAFESITVNIAAGSEKPHYVTVALAIECRDAEIAEIVKIKKSILTDRMIKAVAEKQLSELNTIQGRLLLKADLIKQYNELTKPGGVTDLFFSEFALQ